MNKEKYCYKCKKYKFYTEFYKNKYKNDGHAEECKLCCKQYLKIKQTEENYKQKQREYREKHKDKIKKYKEQWYIKNKKQLSIISKEKYNNNKKHYSIINKTYKEKNKETIKKFYETNKCKPEYVSRRLYNHAYERNKKHNENSENKLEFTITREWVLEQVIKIEKCPILEVNFIISDKINSYSRNLDRLDSNIGYTIENTILVSRLANTIKSNGSIQDLEKLYFYIKNISILYNKSWIEKFTILNLEKQEIFIDVNKGKNRSPIKKNISYLLHGRAKSRSNNKNMDFSITENDILIPKYCPILGIPLLVNKGSCCSNSISIDRIDNNKGYTKENIQIISHKANTMKNCASLEEIKKVYFAYKKYFK